MLSFRNVSFLINIDLQEGELASGKDSGSKRRVRLELIYHISLQLLLRPHHQLIWKQDSVTIWEADQGSICCIDIIVAIQSHWLTDTEWDIAQSDKAKSVYSAAAIITGQYCATLFHEIVRCWWRFDSMNDIVNCRQRSIRSDQIAWTDGINPPCPGIR